MSEVFKEIRRNGFPYRIQVSEKCKNIIKWCLEHDPKKRPTCVELLNHILTQDAARIASSQSVRLTFSPLDNFDGKSRLFDKRDSLRPRLELAPPTISIDSVKKEEILKSPY
jgi:serine/threonine protein kinase